jgi:predicted RND superfamily exporter protein
MKTFVNLINKHAVLILLASLAITAALAPGIRKITIQQEAVENSFTAPNELIRSVQSINQSFGVNTRTVAISVETQDNWHITDSHTLEVISHITSALKSVPAIRRETLLSLTSLGDVTSSEGSIESTPFIQHYPHDESEDLRPPHQ